ncbi:MAG: polysaccharide deacetylase family protein [Aristaeellaceae bacterium]
MKKWISLLLCLTLTCLSVSALAWDAPFLVRYGDREQKQVAVTIDDCFNIDYVRQAYELSQRYDVPITFFILGINLEEQDAELWRAIAESQNELGNHTYGHCDLPAMDNSGIYNQVMRAQSCLDETLGYHYPMQVFRPPYGHMNRNGKNHVNSMIQTLGFEHAILWDVSQTDFEQCRRSVQNGSILLFHTNTLDLRCMEQLIPWLLEEGYELVTVSQMLGMEPVATSTDLYEYVSYGDWQKSRGVY